MARLLIPMADFLDPTRGPEQTGDFSVSPGFFFLLFGVGFLMGGLGHVMKSRLLVGVGILLIFMATVFLPIALKAAN